MISRVGKNIKVLIYSILEGKFFPELNKPRKDFIMCVLWHILSIKGKINFLQFGRFSTLCEQTYRNQFEKRFDFFAFNNGEPTGEKGRSKEFGGKIDVENLN